MPVYIEKINDDVDRPTTGQIKSNLPFRKLENRKKAEICNYMLNNWSLTTCQLLGRAIVPVSRLEVAPEKVFVPLRAPVSTFPCVEKIG